LRVDSVTFGYRSILKKEFINGNIPIKKDITGHKLDKRNVTLDHTVPKARGGKSTLSNYSIMDMVTNMNRGTKSLKGLIDIPSLIDYIIVLLNTKTEYLDGIDYLKKWLPNLRKEV
jgi:hypothetical protein